MLSFNASSTSYRATALQHSQFQAWSHLASGRTEEFEVCERLAELLDLPERVARCTNLNLVRHAF